MLGILAGCNEQQGQPADVASLPNAVPVAQQAPIDMRREIGIATAACLVSEAQGPQTLQSLREKGYTAIKEMGAVYYVKTAPSAGLVVPDSIRVHDPNNRLSCTIEVPRRDGYTYFSQVSEALRSQGFARVAGRNGGYRYAKGDLRVMLSGRSSTYDFYSQITIGRMTAATDKTCTDASLSDAAKQGC